MIQLQVQHAIVASLACLMIAPVLPSELQMVYVSQDVPRSYKVFDPQTGKVVGQGQLEDKPSAQAKSGSTDQPRVLVYTAD